MSIFGVDYAPPSLNVPALKLKGAKFVCRYLAPKDPIYAWKRMTRAEANVLKLAKIDVVGVFETTADRARKGYGAGQLDAEAAIAHLQELDAPVSAPVYFAVDFDASLADQVQINGYFDGVASRIKKERIGGYGGYYVVKRLFDAGKITYGWQTRAWSGGQWDRRAQLQQYSGGKIGGLSVDYNRALAKDYGQWHTPSDPPAKKFLIHATFKDGSEHWLPVNRLGASYEMSRFLGGKYKALEFSRAKQGAK